MQGQSTEQREGHIRATQHDEKAVQKTFVVIYGSGYGWKSYIVKAPDFKTARAIVAGRGQSVDPWHTHILDIEGMRTYVRK